MREFEQYFALRLIVTLTLQRYWLPFAQCLDERPSSVAHDSVVTALGVTRISDVECMNCKFLFPGGQQKTPGRHATAGGFPIEQVGLQGFDRAGGLGVARTSFGVRKVVTQIGADYDKGLVSSPEFFEHLGDIFAFGIAD